MLESLPITNTIIFTSIALTLSVYETIAYLYSIFKGQTRPHIFTYFNWSILAAITAYAQFKLDGGFSVWIFTFVAFCMVITTIAAYFKGEKDITNSDWATFIFALSIIPVWYFSKQPVIALILIMIIDLCTYYPTVRKSWTKPYSEPAKLYGLTVISSICIALSINNPTIENMVYPIFAIILDASFVMILLTKRKYIKLYKNTQFQ